MIPPRLVLATANPGKVREFDALIREWGAVEVLSLAAFPSIRLPEENGTLYGENARAKAEAVAVRAKLPALGDDSGLEVDALGGEPGIRSARYAGPQASDADRIAKLLAALAGVSGGARGARFCCAVALAWPDGRVEAAEGECRGRIATAPVGSGGFGYDPIFVADELGQTFGAALRHDKQRASHRARAVRALGDRLRRA